MSTAEASHALGITEENVKVRLIAPAPRCASASPPMQAAKFAMRSPSTLTVAIVW